MEKNATIVCFGDSITRGYFPHFARQVRQRPSVRVLNQGVNGDTAANGLLRVRELTDLAPSVAIVGFGMNDFLKGVPVPVFRKNLENIISRAKNHGIRVILNLINPVMVNDGTVEDRAIDVYNQIIREQAMLHGLVVNNVPEYWRRHLASSHEGLEYEGCDFLHPNQRGYVLIAERLNQLISRSMTRVVWQFNGANGKCSYCCPYCYEPAEYHSGHHFRCNTEIWREAFKNTFGCRRLNFYLSFGEPTVAECFSQVVDMIESEPRWKLIVLTNLSVDLSALYRRRIALEGRLFIVASFHPSMVRLNNFIERILMARRWGIEIPVVYVMWPPQIRGFDNEFFSAFQANRILVHVRRFGGVYRGREYPQSYSWEQIKVIAKYMDDLTIRYMLCDQSAYGKESYAGMSYLLVRDDGELWVCPQWKGEDRGMGNILRGTARIGLEPEVITGQFSDGTTDGIANFLESGLDELDDNHIISFSRQVGITLDEKNIAYPNMNTDFEDRVVQRNLGFEFDGTAFSSECFKKVNAVN